MKALLIVVGVLFLIGCIPVSVLFRYCGEIELKLIVLFFKIGILPKKPLSRKKREKAEEKKAAKDAKKAEAKKRKKEKQQAQGLIAKPGKMDQPSSPKKPLKDKLEALIPWAKLAAGFVGEFFHRKLTVTRLRIRAALGGCDPARTARTVGKAWETIGVALPILERAFRIRERKIAVYPDFTAAKTELEAELKIRVRIGGLVLFALKYGFKALSLYLRQKGVFCGKKANHTKTEPEETEAKVGKTI